MSQERGCNKALGSRGGMDHLSRAGQLSQIGPEHGSCMRPQLHDSDPWVTCRHVHGMRRHSWAQRDQGLRRGLTLDDVLGALRHKQRDGRGRLHGLQQHPAEASRADARGVQRGHQVCCGLRPEDLHAAAAISARMQSRQPAAAPPVRFAAPEQAFALPQGMQRSRWPNHTHQQHA